MWPQLSVYSPLNSNKEGDNSKAAVCDRRGPRSGSSCFVQPTRRMARRSPARPAFMPKKRRLNLSGCRRTLVCMEELTVPESLTESNLSGRIACFILPRHAHPRPFEHARCGGGVG